MNNLYALNSERKSEMIGVTMYTHEWEAVQTELAKLRETIKLLTSKSNEDRQRGRWLAQELLAQNDGKMG